MVKFINDKLLNFSNFFFFQKKKKKFAELYDIYYFMFSDRSNEIILLCYKYHIYIYRLALLNAETAEVLVDRRVGRVVEGVLPRTSPVCRQKKTFDQTRRTLRGHRVSRFVS